MLRPEDLAILKVFHEAIHWDKGGEVVLRCGTHTGRVYFGAGKIAWISVSTLQKTFTQYLIENSPIGEEEARIVFEDCQRTGDKFAETVVEWGLLDEPSVRRLLLQHISECLLEILTWPGVDSMFMPEEKVYKESLTFSFSEVLGTVMIMDTTGKLPFRGYTGEEVLAALSEMELEKPVEQSPAAAAPAAQEPPQPAQEETAEPVVLTQRTVADLEVTDPPAAAPPEAAPAESLQDLQYTEPLVLTPKAPPEEPPAPEDLREIPEEDLTATIAEPPLSEAGPKELEGPEQPQPVDPVEKYADPESVPDLSLERTQEMDVTIQQEPAQAAAEPPPEEPPAEAPPPEDAPEAPAPEAPPSYYQDSGPPPVSYDDEPDHAPKKGKGKLLVIVGVVAVLVIVLAIGLSGDKEPEKAPDEPGKMEPLKPPAPEGAEGEPSKAEGAEKAPELVVPVETHSPDAGPAAEPAPVEPPPVEAQPEPEPEPEPEPDLPKITYGARGKGKGKIRVISRPSRAPIYLDGVFTGKLTPHTFRKIPAGIEHTIMVEKKRRRAAYSRFKLKRNRTKLVKLYPKKKGRRPGDIPVRITSKPKGALIFMDGKNTRKKTPASVDIRLGSATKLELRRRGYRKWGRTVRPIPEVDLTLQARLRKRR